MNLVPKDGGNQFKGGSKITKSPRPLAGRQPDRQPQDRAASTGVDRICELLRVQHRAGRTARQGQAVVLRRVPAWPATTSRSPTRSSRRTDLPYPGGLRAVRGRRSITCDQGISDEKMDNPILRLTWQVSPRNKVALYNDRAMRLRGHAMTAGLDPRTASVLWNTPNLCRPARPSGPRPCRLGCSSRVASRSTVSATTTCIRTVSWPLAALRSSTRAFARTTPPPARSGTPPPRSWATIRTATCSPARPPT